MLLQLPRVLVTEIASCGIRHSTPKTVSHVLSRKLATDGAVVQIRGKVFKTIKDGSAYILIPPNARTFIPVGDGGLAGAAIHFEHFGKYEG